MLFGGRLELLKGISTPIRPTQRTGYLLAVLNFVLDPSLHAFSVQVSSAPESAV